MAYEGGYSSGVNQLSEMQSRDVMNAMRAQAMQAQFQQQQQQQAQRAAQAKWGSVLQGMMGPGVNAFGAPQATPPGFPPPPPGTPAGGPQPPGPGVSSPPAAQPMAGPPGGGMPPPPMAGPPAQGPAPAPAAAPAPQPGPPPPFQPMPTQGPPQAAPGSVPPPPMPRGVPQMPGGATGGGFQLPQLLEGLKKSGVPAEQWGQMLDNLPEPVKAHAALEIKNLHEQNAALMKWADITTRQSAEDRKERQGNERLDNQAKRDEERHQETMRAREISERRNDISERRMLGALGKIAGGQGNVKGVEYIYPKGEDGKPDQTQEPIGTRGTTKTGKIIYTNAEGNQVQGSELSGGSAKEAKATAGEGGDFTDQDYKYWTEVLQKGGNLPPRLATTPGGKKLMAKVMQGAARGDVSPVEMLANQAEFMGEKAGQRTLGTRTANIEMAATEAQGLSALALKASDEWKRTGLKSLNDIEKAVQSRTASPELRAFTAANTSFINAYARAINPQGVGTVADKEHAREMLEVGFSKGDYQAAIKQLQKEIGTAQASPGQVKSSMRERFTGGANPAANQGGWKVEKVQ